MKTNEHQHNFIEHDTYFICDSCQKKKMKIFGDGIIRNNGRKYRLKVEQNKKAFFYPNTWLQFYSLLTPKTRICFDILIQTGARINEAHHITPADIDEERNVLHLRMTKVRSKIGEKNPTGRKIPISSQFKKLLLIYAKNNKLKADDEFPMLSTPRVSQLLKQNCKAIGKADYKDISAHNIRKTFQNWLLALGVDPFILAQHLGHTLQVAFSNYANPNTFTDTDRKLAREILGDLYL